MGQGPTCDMAGENGDLFIDTGVKKIKWFLSLMRCHLQPHHIGLSYVMNAAIRPQNGSNLYDGLLNGNQQ